MENFKAQLDIIEVISHFIPLRREGANYKAICPFHTERSASFVVSQAKGIYHCFGCGASGDAINFIQEYKKLNFTEAVNELCDIFNLQSPLKAQDNLRLDKYKIIREKLKNLSDRYVENLLSNNQLQEYLFNRGFELEDIKKYSLGFCKDREHRDYFNQKESLELGLETDKNPSFFKNRLMISLFNKNFRHIGFVGRTHNFFDFKNAPKYINSKESYLYHKSENLYNLGFAKSHIQKEKKALIVEGYFDALACNKLNLPYAVATGGTAFNKSFLSQLVNYDCELIFLFDNDNAGQKAIQKALNVCLENNYLNIYAGKLKSNAKDIGEVLEKKLTLNLSKSKGLNTLLKYQFSNANTANEKQMLLNSYKERLNKLSNPFLRKDLIQAFKESLNLDISKTLMPKESFKPKRNTHKLELYKSILSNKIISYIAFELLEGEELDSLSESFKNYMFNDAKDKTALDIEMDESIMTLDTIQAKKALMQVISEFYKEKIAQATNKKDFTLALNLSKNLLKLKDEFFTN